ncbi:MAG: outer membrane lipoprotein carrier protein LolA [Acidobacteria bacterium]|nr:outer membrane lipoprotein carrier protein LolA [Acidobacteriota bacterium]
MTQQLALLLTAAASTAAAQNLPAVLGRIDAAAPGFRSMTAKMDRLTHVAIINDSTSELASVRLLRLKAKDVRVSLDFTKPDNRQVAVSDRKVEIYYPKMNRVEEWDIGKYKSLVDQFMLLGFGTSGKDLSKSYAVKYLKEDVAAGQKCSRLELTPKDAKVRQHYTKFELCIAEPGGYPIVQKLVEPSGNYTNITYSDIKINPALAAEAMPIKVPSGVKREFPQR